MHEEIATSQIYALNQPESAAKYRAEITAAEARTGKIPAQR
jgi:hypothetical protein